ncbi:MAG: mechanosensitive ion channel [Eubacteriales bacterium]|nr:mechanosensitive ion channel [Eubacteriales bacterium]
MNQVFMLATQAEKEISEKSEQITSFFSKDNLMNVVDSLCAWSLSMAGKIIGAVLIWIIGKKIIKLCVKLVGRLLDKGSLDVGVKHFIGTALRFVLYAVLVMIVVGQLGFETTSLLTLFGSAALAIGMSLQGSLANFAGGLLILVFKPFQVGDYIVSNGMEGTVSSIELLYTRLHTIDNKSVMMPNGALANSNITNVGSEKERRLDIEIGVSYSADLRKTREVMTEVLKSTESVIKDKEFKVVVKKLADSCVMLESRAWVKQEDYWDTKFALLEKFKNELENNGIDIPFNQLDVHITGLEK